MTILFSDQNGGFLEDHSPGVLPYESAEIHDVIAVDLNQDSRLELVALGETDTFHFDWNETSEQYELSNEAIPEHTGQQDLARIDFNYDGFDDLLTIGPFGLELSKNPDRHALRTGEGRLQS